jgi:hypothetical protein
MSSGKKSSKFTVKPKKHTCRNPITCKYLAVCNKCYLAMKNEKLNEIKMENAKINGNIVACDKCKEPVFYSSTSRITKKFINEIKGSIPDNENAIINQKEKNNEYRCALDTCNKDLKLRAMIRIKNLLSSRMELCHICLDTHFKNLNINNWNKLRPFGACISCGFIDKGFYLHPECYKTFCKINDM